jgi:peptidoglycan hydrolase CwlO-like protein
MLKKILITLLLIPTIFFSFKYVVEVYAEDATTTEEDNSDEIDDLEDEIDELEKKIEDKQGEAQTLSREIENANNQISLTELKIQNSIKNIEKTEKEIDRLENDIDSLSARIDQLIERIEYQEDVLSERIRERYKTREISPIMVLFGTSTLDDLVKKATYLKVMELQDNKVLTQMRATKKTYNRQKTLFEDKKEEEEELQAKLVQEKANLNAYKIELESKKAEKDRLLKLTQNDEARYQKMLAEAKQKLASFSDYVGSTGQGVIGPNGLGGGKGGWYFSQRDSRWAYDKIGNSSYTIFNSGCLVSSVAMVHKYYGYDMDPGKLADKDEYYFWGDMLIPWPAPKGFQYVRLGYGFPESAIDNELDDDNPVIVGVYANNSAGTHFVVLTEGKDGDYKMNDPVWGPDLDFSDYYNTGSIFEAVAFK